MTTSLPDTHALYHAAAKLFKRSEGRSAIAAAAYRSASRLTDERTGQEFDYRRKHTVESFVVSPEGAAAWTRDREQLWNHIEAAEKRKDAQIAREWEISIPRDIPSDQWAEFAREVVAPYVETGAVADIAIHCPKDVNGEDQPHIHVMLTLRVLDESSETGFSKSKNTALESMHSSGGRYGGGERGDALKIERERIADVMNRYLEAASSNRRVSHLSNVARGIVDREPEPTVGEGRKHASRKRRRGDRRTALVSSMRSARILENELSKTEEKIMATNPKFQNFNGIKSKTKQDFKAKLLADRFPDLPADASRADKLHMVDPRDPSMTKIQTRDGGWIEVKGRQVVTYGQRGYADDLAAEIAAAIGADEIQRLEETQSIQRKNSGIRARRQPGDPAPQISAADVESRADKWRSRGFTDITEASDGTWVRIGACRLQDLGDEVRVHGKSTDAAARALLMKAVDEWGSEIEIFGSKDFKDSVWREAQRQGVVVYDRDTGKLYEPSPDVKKAFEADAARNAAQIIDLQGVRNHRAVATLVREAAAGDVAALARLENNDPALTDFITLHLDDDQRSHLAGRPESDIVDALDSFRQYGQEARGKDDERRGTGKRPTVAIPDFDPVAQDNEPPEHRAAITRSLSIIAEDEGEGDEMDFAAEAAKAERLERELQLRNDQRPE